MKAKRIMCLLLAILMVMGTVTLTLTRSSEAVEASCSPYWPGCVGTSAEAVPSSAMKVAVTSAGKSSVYWRPKSPGS